MFSFFKKKKPEPLINQVLGTIRERNGDWSSDHPVMVTLWGNSFKLDVFGPRSSDGIPICPLQEQTYLRFLKEKDANLKLIENAVLDFIQAEDVSLPPSDFIPRELLLNSNGECAVMGVFDTEEEDDAPDLAVVLYPKVAAFVGEEYLNHVYFGVRHEIKEELYGKD